MVRAAEEFTWAVGTYMIEADGWGDATHHLVVRGAAEAMGDNPDAASSSSLARCRWSISRQGRSNTSWPHLPDVAERLDAMTPVRG
jgi:hypothetical protein